MHGSPSGRGSARVHRGSLGSTVVSCLAYHVRLPSGSWLVLLSIPHTRASAVSQNPSGTTVSQAQKCSQCSSTLNPLTEPGPPTLLGTGCRDCSTSAHHTQPAWPSDAPLNTVPASRPTHWLSPLPPMLSPQHFEWLTPSQTCYPGPLTAPINNQFLLFS